MSQNRGVKTRGVSCRWSKAKQLPSCQRNTLHSDPDEYCLFGDAFRRHELHRHHTHVLPLAVPNDISSTMPCSSGVMCHRLHESQQSRPLPRNPPPLTESSVPLPRRANVTLVQLPSTLTLTNSSSVSSSSSKGGSDRLPIICRCGKDARQHAQRGQRAHKHENLVAFRLGRLLLHPVSGDSTEG